MSEAATHVSQEIKFTSIEDCRDKVVLCPHPHQWQVWMLWMLLTHSFGSPSLQIFYQCGEQPHPHLTPAGAAQIQELIIKREGEIRAWPFWFNFEPSWRVILVPELPVGSPGLWVVLDGFSVSHSVQFCSFPSLPKVQFQENSIIYMKFVHQLLTSIAW